MTTVWPAIAPRRNLLRFLAVILLPVLLDVLHSAAAAAASPAGQNAAAKLETGSAEVTVVCFGDSVTGLYYHTGGRRAYTDMLGIGLQQAGPKARVKTINAGLSGHTTRDALKRIQRDVLAHRPTLVTVMFGLNDMTRVPLDEYRSNLVAIVEQCRAAASEVVLCTPNSVINTASRPAEKLVQYCEAVRLVAREQGVAVCDAYNAFEAVRKRDLLAWRLMMSDEIHPNMAGHKLLAEALTRTITGKTVSLAEVKPPSPAIPRTLSFLKTGKAIKILAMPPFDALIGPALKQLNSQAVLEITAWPTAGQTLVQLEQDAQKRVRQMKPDLVVIAVPRSADAASLEQFIRSHSWIMNWSLSFGKQEWDCLVIHPSVFDTGKPDDRRDDLIRRLVKAQDLSLIDRQADDRSSPGEILVTWLRLQFAH